MAPLNRQTSFIAGELAPSLYARIDLSKAQSGARLMRNMFVHAHGGVSNRPGTKFIAPVRDEAQKSRLISFAFSTTQTYVLEFSHLCMRVFRNGGLVVDPESGAVVEVETPYTEADLATLKYAQSADVMYLVHPNHAPQTLAREDHHIWQLQGITFAPDIRPPSGLHVASQNVGGGSVTLKYCVTAISASNSEESHASGATSLNGPIKTEWRKGGHVTLRWNAVPGADRYAVYKAENGVFGFIGQTENVTFRDDNISPELSDTPPKPRNPFKDDNHPATVTFHEQRLSFAASNTRPQTFWMSQSGHYHNMSVSQPSKADDALTFTIAARQVNEVRHFVSLNDLVVLTSGGVWKVASSDNGPITPSTIQVRQQEEGGGASHIAPIVIGGSILFVESKGNRVRDMMYTLDSDSYSGQDLSVLSHHLFDGHTIVDWAYAREPYSIIWCVRDDGVMLGLTYMREHKVWAWHQHQTNGAFESVTTVSEGQEDAVYVTVRRTVNGVERRYIERFASRTFEDIRDAFFVDAGLSYRGEPVTTLSGLEHLTGQTVSILADGNVVPQQVVTDGQVILPHAARVVHVGLPYVADLVPLAFEARATEGALLARKRQVARVRLVLHHSRGFWVGSNLDNLVEYKQRSTEPMGTAILPKSGVVDVALPPQWSDEAGLVIRQSDPLPLTVLALLPEIATGA